MNISDFPQPDSIFENYENDFKQMKVQDLITLHNVFQDKNKDKIYIVSKYFPFYQSLFSIIGKKNNYIFMLKYFSGNKKFITEKSNWVKVKLTIERIIKNINYVYKGDPKYYLIDNILSNDNFRELYFDILNTELVQNFFNNTTSKNHYMLNKMNIKEKAEEVRFFKNNIKTLILPTSIKGFTNRFLNIFLNKTGYNINNTEDNEDTQKVRYFYKYYLVTSSMGDNILVTGNSSLSKRRNNN